MYKIIICDDDKNFIKYMKEMIYKCDEIKREKFDFHCFLSGEDFVKELETMQSCDLLILDMQMEGMDGHSTAKRFRKVFPDSVLVFCSGVIDPTDESFKTTPYRYLQKNYTDEKMLYELREIIQKMYRTKIVPCIIGKNHYNIIKLKPSEILFIENYKRGSIIHIRETVREHKFEDRITTKLKLAELYKTLKEYYYEYAHNSYIVNLECVVKLSSERIIKLENGCELNISRSKLPIFRKALSEFLGNKYE